MSHIIIPDDTFRPWRICKHTRLEVEAAAAEYNQALDELEEIAAVAGELVAPYLCEFPANVLRSDVSIPASIEALYRVYEIPAIDTVGMQYYNGTPFPINSWLKTARSMRAMAKRLNKLVERAAAKSAA